MAAEHDVEQIWHDFWVEVLDKAVEGKPLGQSIAVPGAYWDQIKREMYDYHRLLDRLDGFTIDDLLKDVRWDGYVEGLSEGRLEAAS